MTRPAAAIACALASPLAGCAAGIATHNGAAIALVGCILLAAAPIISPPHATERSAP